MAFTALNSEKLRLIPWYSVEGIKEVSFFLLKARGFKQFISPEERLCCRLGYKQEGYSAVGLPMEATYHLASRHTPAT